MDSRNRKIIVLAIVLLIAGAMVASFGRSLFALNTPGVVLPDSSAAQGDPSGSGSPSEQYQQVSVNPRTAPAVVATLARPDSYYRELTVETFWAGGSSSVQVQVWADGGWSHSRQVRPSGVIRHDLTGEDTLYYWYEGSSRYETAPADERSSDLAQHIPTYETVVDLPPEEITAAGYELRGELPCIFVEVQPEPLPFTDVKESDWFHDSVRYVYDNGLMDGVGDGQFAPNATTTRAQLVTILYRLAGEPDVSGDVGFTDVAAGQWYTDAVAWAAQKGIVNGISETEFAPAGDLTREQLATILYRYSESMGYDVSAQADLSGFPDAGDIQSYATQALSWAVAEGLLQGFEDDSLQPGGTATRAQIAAVLMRFLAAVPTE